MLQASSQGLSACGRPTWRSRAGHRVSVFECLGCARRVGLGMQVVWCNRYNQRVERLPGAPDCEIGSLAQLPALVGAA